MKRKVAATVVLALAVISCMPLLYQEVIAQEYYGQSQQQDYWTLTVYIQAKFGWDKVWIGVQGPFGQWVKGYFATGQDAYATLQLPTDQFPAGQKFDVDISGPGITDLPTIFTRVSTGQDQTYQYIYHEDGSSEDLILQDNSNNNSGDNSDSSSQLPRPHTQPISHIPGIVTPPFRHYCPYPYGDPTDKCAYIPK